MNSKILIVIIVVLGLAGIGIYGYFQAVNPVAGGQNSPKIEISPASYDFGQVEFDTTSSHEFNIINSGQSALEIKRIATSCGCTTAEINQRTIEPGQSAVLTVNYNPAAMGDLTENHGQQERIVYIKSNDPANPQVNVVISAFVK